MRNCYVASESSHKSSVERIYRHNPIILNPAVGRGWSVRFVDHGAKLKDERSIAKFRFISLGHIIGHQPCDKLFYLLNLP